VDLGVIRLRSLSSLATLDALVSLDVSANRISDLKEVDPVCSLPEVTALNLQGNLVTRVVDYRLKVLERFGQRCPDICLDNEAPSQSEVDKVSVRMALKVANEGGDHTVLFGHLPRRVATTTTKEG